MGAKLLIRLDDASPYMDSKKWDRVESILDKYNVKPIVAVIPNNKDKEVQHTEFDENFWDKVKKWNDKKWIIALHGYDHCFITKEKGIIPRNSYSEFAGVDLELQRKKIRCGYNIFLKNNIKPKVWVAPAHSFDKNTLTALKEETEIDIISDGLSFYPYRKKDFVWIPQQVCHIPKRPFGLWKTCLHPNSMNEKDFEKFEDSLKKTSLEIINFDDVKINSIKGFIGKIYYLYYQIIKIKKMLRRLL